MKHVTLEQLELVSACSDQLDVFARLFPSGKALVTIKHAKELADVFNWDWAAKKLLQPNTNKTYAAAMAEVDKAFDAAMDEVNKAYWAARAEADKSRVAARAEADKAYWAAKAEADKAYWAAITPANKAYAAAMDEVDKSRVAARAEAFARAYLAQPAKLQPAR